MKIGSYTGRCLAASPMGPPRSTAGVRNKQIHTQSSSWHGSMVPAPRCRGESEGRQAGLEVHFHQRVESSGSAPPMYRRGPELPQVQLAGCGCPSRMTDTSYLLLLCWGHQGGLSLCSFSCGVSSCLHEGMEAAPASGSQHWTYLGWN